MLTKEMAAYHSLPDEVKPAVLALSVVMNRIKSLPARDQAELFELFQEWNNSSHSPEDRQSIVRAMEEILAQCPISVRQVSQARNEPLTRGLRAWTEHVAKKIKELREKAGLTQVELSEKADLPQSHVSRLENAEHSPTNKTLEKLAKALRVTVGEIDPCAEG